LVGVSVLESMIVLPATNTLSVLSSPTMYYVQIVPVEDSTGCIVLNTNLPPLISILIGQL